MPPQQTPSYTTTPGTPEIIQNSKKLKKKTSNDPFHDLSSSSSSSSSTSTTLPFSHAPHYLKFNPFITSGYRNNLTSSSCLASAFAWTNETVNIWTHFVGWVVFFYLTGGATRSLAEDGEAGVIKIGVLLCFQACMLLSACYHTFCCSSDTSYRKWLTADLFGVSMALLGIYLSGIYFAFKCDSFWLNFYFLTVLGIFCVALSAQFSSHTQREEGFQWRLVLFGAWAAYGVVPTLQWVWMRGGGDFFSNWDMSQVDGEVKHLLPRIITMYFLSSLAFFFYVSRFPERLFPGRFNYLLSSHNLWHVLIFVALYFWYSEVVLDHYSIPRPCTGLGWN